MSKLPVFFYTGFTINPKEDMTAIFMAHLSIPRAI